MSINPTVLVLRAAEITLRDLIANGTDSEAFEKFVSELDRLMILAEIGLVEDENGNIIKHDDY